MPWGFQESEAPRFQDSRHMKVVKLPALRTGHLYPQEIILVFIYVRGWVDHRAIVRPEGLSQWNISVTSIPGSFRLVAPCLNQLRYRVPPKYLLYRLKSFMVLHSPSRQLESRPLRSVPFLLSIPVPGFFESLEHHLGTASLNKPRLRIGTLSIEISLTPFIIHGIKSSWIWHSECFTTFMRNTTPLSSEQGVQESAWTLKTKVFCSFETSATTHLKSQLRKPESSNTQMWKPQNSVVHFPSCNSVVLLLIVLYIQYIPMNHSFAQSVSVGQNSVIASIPVRYSPFWVLDSLKRRLHTSLPPSRLLHPRIPRTCNASFWSKPSHLVLGFPTNLVLWYLDLEECIKVKLKSSLYRPKVA
jgi:hypothetical protein